MRYGSLLFGACTLLASGCAGLLSTCGKDITNLATREDVYARFGEPKASGLEDGGAGPERAAWEEFHTRELIANPYAGPGYSMGLMMSFGLSELYFVPAQLTRLTSAVLLGEELRFTYDEAGRVVYATVDGEPHHVLCRRARFAQREAAQDREGSEQATLTRSARPDR